MASRLNLQTDLEELLGSRNVYFQPPLSVQLKYPCIIYKRRTGDTKFADNKPYNFEKCYEIMLIDKNPDSIFIDKIANRFPKSRYDRHFTSENLNHDIFVIYY
jgi:hypothetical protein